MTETVQPVLTFDEFKKMQLVIGKVKSVENHPDADKLYLVQVDLGTEIRQVVAGLRPYYTPDQLVGKSVVIVANLATAKIRGVDSNGMLLAASDENGRAILLQPDADVPAGSKVR